MTVTSNVRVSFNSKRDRKFRWNRTPWRNRRFCYLLAAACFAAGPCYGQEYDSKNDKDRRSGWYVSALGGVGWLADTSFQEQGASNTLSQTQGADSGRAKASHDMGFSAGMNAGYDFGRWRLEGDYLYQTNDNGSLVFSTPFSSLPGGAESSELSSVILSLNVLRSWRLGRGDRIQSFAGAGIAWAQEVDVDFRTMDGERSFSADGVGVQLIAGIEYALTARWSTSLEGRYLRVSNLDLDEEGGALNSVGSAIGVKADYERTSVLMSLRYRF